ncbi:hypothetical protein NDI38_27475 [Stenomitos frigidus AS-A4]|uniref:Uncharacterized protein n=1 Tax=Stenomitos frigidus AS-A4 TaxID=2933935 RepID=A0ABV0KSC5_9CYAN|nr:hypothetical protein [Phormidium sp. FACHB-592]
MEIKQKLAAFLCTQLKLELSDKKMLVTHAHDEKARFLGYEREGQFTSVSTGKSLIAGPISYLVLQTSGVRRLPR